MKSCVASVISFVHVQQDVQVVDVHKCFDTLHSMNIINWGMLTRTKYDANINEINKNDLRRLISLERILLADLNTVRPQWTLKHCLIKSR